MIPIETLKQQHEEICELLSVLALLVPDETARKTRIVENLFAELAKKVNAHIVLEDGTLYKDLLVHQDQRTARNFLSGSHELKRLFSDYIRHACRHGPKNKNCEAFVKETEDVFELLRDRIKIEEDRFYPLADERGLDSRE